MVAKPITAVEASELVVSEFRDFIFDQGDRMVSLWRQAGFSGGTRNDLAALVCAMPDFALSTDAQKLVLTFAHPGLFRPIDTPLGLIVPQYTFAQSDKGYCVDEASLAIIIEAGEVTPEGYIDIECEMGDAGSKLCSLEGLVKKLSSGVTGRLLSDNRGYASGGLPRGRLLIYSPQCPLPFRRRDRWMKARPNWRAADMHCDMLDRLFSPFPAYGVEEVVERDPVMAAARLEAARRRRTATWLRFGEVAASGVRLVV